MGEAVEHQADCRQGDHGLGNFGQRLIIPRQPPPPSEPTERSLDHPPARLHDEAGGTCGAADDDQHQTGEIAGEQGCKPIVDAIGEHDPEPSVEWLHALQEIAEAVGILDVGRMDDDAE
jgi:hypothetical protein